MGQKRIGFRKLGMDSKHRWAMLRNMELRRVADNMITYAKAGDLHNRRMAEGVVREKGAMSKLFELLGPRYRSRQGGYTRVIKLAKPRRGDSADMAVIEFVDRSGELRKAKPGVRKVEDIVAAEMANMKLETSAKA